MEVENIEELLERKRVFKLILGAANQNLSEIEAIVAIYAKAGCRFFDVAAYPSVLEAVERGLSYSINPKERKNYFICISVGTRNDPHVSKCRIDEYICDNCGVCIGICGESAIYQEHSKAKISTKYCIGCQRCKKICSKNAIESYCMYKDFDEIMSEIVKYKIDCLEFHINLNDRSDFEKKWKQINSCYSGLLSIAITRGGKSDEEIVDFIKEVIKDREPYSTIIQADGVPIGVGADDFRTNLQALAFVDMLQRENLPVYIFASGGVNPKFVQAANKCELKLTGIAMGSYARNVIKNYTEKKDLFKNKKLFDDAVEEAKSVVRSSLMLKD